MVFNKLFNDICLDEVSVWKCESNEIKCFDIEVLYF